MKMTGENLKRGCERRVTGYGLWVLAVFLAMVCSCSANKDVVLSGGEKTAVIFDTDIGSDIDDTWALALLIQSAELDVKLITTAVDDTAGKAKTVAKMLEIAGRTDIAIGTGIGVHKHGEKGNNQAEWTEDYELSSYPGVIHRDGVGAIIDTVMASAGPIKIIAVGPLPNIAAALEREPRVAEKAEFIGMHGSVRRGYGGRGEIDAEYNVEAFVKEAQKVFTAGWEMTITPLDTCGIVRLEGKKYEKVLKSKNPLARAVIENYRVWTRSQGHDERRIEGGSTTLYDTVAVYLAISTELVEIEKLEIRVSDEGYMVIEDGGKVIGCATEWKDLGGFEDFLVERLAK